MNILELKEIEQVAGGWSWKGAIFGGGAGLGGGGAFGGPLGAGVGLGVGFVSGGLLGERWTDNGNSGGASGSW